MICPVPKPPTKVYKFYSTRCRATGTCSPHWTFDILLASHPLGRVNFSPFVLGESEGVAVTAGLGEIDSLAVIWNPGEKASSSIQNKMANTWDGRGRQRTS